MTVPFPPHHAERSPLRSFPIPTHRPSPVPLTCLLPGLLLVLSACGGDGSGDAAEVGRTIEWRACEGSGTLDCATLAVPLVHDGRDGRTIAVDLIRLPSSGEAAEPLLLNPGGPGGSGTDLVRIFEAVGTLPAALRDRYDVIGFDPRGIGASERIDCEDLGLDDIEEFAATIDDLARIEAQHAAFAEACHRRHGDVLAHLGSNAVVRDMDLIRAALGAARLNFIGYSYGTRLAALYLERFPATSGRIVLDGPLSPDGLVEPLIEAMAVASQRNLEALLDACGTRVADCERATIEQRLSALVLEGIAAGDEEVIGAAGLLYEAVLDPALGDLLVAPLLEYLRTGDFAPVAALTALIESLEPDVGDVESLDNDTVQRAVFCADDPRRPTLEEYRASFARMTATAPLFGRALLPDIGMSCAGWPASQDPVVPIATSDAPQALVVAGRSDAQTAFELAAPMADALGATLLVSDHEGHTVLFTDKSSCTDALGLAFLLDGTLPTAPTCDSSASVPARLAGR